MIDDKDKLRILWDCHNKQLGENRAVGRALDDLRWRMNAVCNLLSLREKPYDNVVTECQHQSDPEYVDPGAPGIPKGVLQKCLKCHGTYFPIKCQHEPNLHGFLASVPPTFLCNKCGEFYR